VDQGIFFLASVFNVFVSVSVSVFFVLFVFFRRNTTLHNGMRESASALASDVVQGVWGRGLQCGRFVYFF
jgi:hypothetical protein